MKTAVIDIGTNTFNLLIVENHYKQQITILENRKISVKLGKGGISQKKIDREAFLRASKAIKEFFDIICEQQVAYIHLIATEGVRIARNNQEFLSHIKAVYNIPIEVISGDREAELIFEGVKQTIKLASQPVLILDIGGGSNELIIANNTGILWKKSFPLGVTRLFESFNPSNPITYNEMEEIEEHIKSVLQPFFTEIKNYNIQLLVGASGAFENLPAMIDSTLPLVESETSKSPKTTALSVEKLEELIQILLGSTIEERRKMKGLEKFRADVIVMAAIFLDIILKKTKITEVIVSPFALKEGMAYSLLKQA